MGSAHWIQLLAQIHQDLANTHPFRGSQVTYNTAGGGAMLGLDNEGPTEAVHCIQGT